MSDDRSAILAAMYQQDDEDETPLVKADIPVLDSGAKKIRRIVVGGVAYEVPSSEYVESLERKILDQANKIVELHAGLRKLENTLKNTIRFVNNGNKNLRDIQRELDNKIDRRD